MRDPAELAQYFLAVVLKIDRYAFSGIQKIKFSSNAVNSIFIEGNYEFLVAHVNHTCVSRIC